MKSQRPSEPCWDAGPARVGNGADDPACIVRLVGQVVRVSVETVKIVNELPEEFEPK